MCSSSIGALSLDNLGEIKIGIDFRLFIFVFTISRLDFCISVFGLLETSMVFVFWVFDIGTGPKIVGRNRIDLEHWDRLFYSIVYGIWVKCMGKE